MLHKGFDSQFESKVVLRELRPQSINLILKNKTKHRKLKTSLKSNFLEQKKKTN